VRPVSAFAVMVITGIALAGCGSSGDDKPAAPSGTIVHLEAGDIYYKPTELTLKAGGDTTLEVANIGPSEHNLTIEGLKVDKVLEAGKTVNVKLTPAAGTYPFHCSYHPDQMTGTITVS
jgi:plastocyanin